MYVMEDIAKEIEVAYFIDRNAKNIVASEINVYELINIPKKVDLILVTLIKGYTRICAMIEKETGIKTLSIMQIVNNIENV